MLLTRECDYAIRIIRVLSNGNLLNVKEISAREEISSAITYKLARKLEKSGFLTSVRGSQGGYRLNCQLTKICLYDVFLAVDKDLFITDCVNCEFQCKRNTVSSPCMVHGEFCRIQKIMEKELKAKPLSEILKGK